MQLAAAAVTPPAEHAARRPAEVADAAAADAGVRQLNERKVGGLQMFRKGRTAFMLVGLIITMTCPATAEQGRRGVGGGIPFEVIGWAREARGPGGGGPRVEVIRNREDLISFWQELGVGPIPDVDLRSHTVIVYYLGGCSTTCDYLTVEGLAVRAGTLVVQGTAHVVLGSDCRPVTDCPAAVIATINWPHDVVEQTELVMEDPER